MYNVWFDTMRNPPNDTWFVVRDPEKLKDMLVSNLILNLSMDHDFYEYGQTESGHEINGVMILNWIEESGHLPNGRIFVHSINQVGRVKMLKIIDRLGKL